MLFSTVPALYWSVKPPVYLEFLNSSFQRYCYGLQFISRLRTPDTPLQCPTLINYFFHSLHSGRSVSLSDEVEPDVQETGQKPLKSTKKNKEKKRKTQLLSARCAKETLPPLALIHYYTKIYCGQFCQSGNKMY